MDASPPNTAIATASGSRSQLANIMAAVVVLVVALVATAPLADLPEAMLAATLVFIATKLFRVGELRTILRFDRVEFALAAVTLLVVALVGIEQGVAVAIVLSLADRTRRTARPRDAVLGREPGTDHWIPADIGRPTEQVPGILVYLVYAPLWYGNADYFRLRIRHLVDAALGPVHAVVIDADAISDIDYTGLQALRDLTAELRQRGVSHRDRPGVAPGPPRPQARRAADPARRRPPVCLRRPGRHRPPAPPLSGPRDRQNGPIRTPQPGSRRAAAGVQNECLFVSRSSVGPF